MQRAAPKLAPGESVRASTGTIVLSDHPYVAMGAGDTGSAARVLIDIALASAANFLNQADRNVMPIAVIPMAEELGWDLMQRGVVLSAFAYGYITTQLPGGALAARLPPLQLLFAAVLGWSLATLFTPVAARLGYSTVLAARVLMGVCEGFCLPAIFQLFSARVPASRRARAFSVMLGCGSGGQDVFGTKRLKSWWPDWTMKADASESLSLVPVLAAYFRNLAYGHDDRVVRQHAAAFLLLAKVVEMLLSTTRRMVTE